MRWVLVALVILQIALIIKLHELENSDALRVCQQINDAIERGETSG